MATVQKCCEICGKQFEVPEARALTAVTCSLKCRGELIAKRYAEQRVKQDCPACGKEFSYPKCHEGRRTYCSTKCADKFRATGQVRGPENHNWKGGTADHSEGYLYVSAADHPSSSNGYVFEHRIVMEQWMRESAPDHHFMILIDGVPYLKPEVEVHHINEVKRDNKRSNLLACTKAAHRAIHNGSAVMQGEVWPDIDGLEPYQPRNVTCTCLTCGTQFKKKLCEVKRGSGKYCSRKCYSSRPKK